MTKDLRRREIQGVPPSPRIFVAGDSLGARDESKPLGTGHNCVLIFL